MKKNKKSTKIVPNTIVDTVFSKALYIDGKKVSGVQAINIEMDIRDEARTLVCVTFAIKRGSLQIENILDAEGKLGLQDIHFSTCNESFK